MILAGDVGGTKCNLALLEPRHGTFEIVLPRRYTTSTFKNFEQIIDLFLREAMDGLSTRFSPEITAAGFGVAGPVIGGAVRLTNVGWGLDVAALRKQIGTPHVVLLNDLAATGYSLPLLRPEDLCALNIGTRVAEGPQALIAAGTGLGEAILRWTNGDYVVEPSEGGHCDFAPRTEREIELLRHMKKFHRNVSFEIVVSGRAFLALHQFLDPQVRHPTFEEPAADPAPEIGRLGLEETCAVCVETLDLWANIYGAEAGNLALKALSVGGLYVAGGIAAKLLPKMTDGTFIKAFSEKSTFRDMLSRIPVHVVLNEQAPLLGAARQAAALAY
jgi:glucokinase